MGLRTDCAVSLAYLISTTGCGQAPFDGIYSESRLPELKINGGTPTNDRPDIGAFDWNLGSEMQGCTGTLVAPRWVLTAAHCVNYSTQNLDRYLFHPGDSHATNIGDVIGNYSVQKILNFAPSGIYDICKPNLLSDCPNEFTYVNETLDYSGTDDIALVLLKNPVPASVVPKPGTIASSLPQDGSFVTSYGYGETLTDPNSDVKNTTQWVFHEPATSTGLSNNRYPIRFPPGSSDYSKTLDADWIDNSVPPKHKSWVQLANDLGSGKYPFYPSFSTVTGTSGGSGALNHGDSGGPVLDGAGNIWAVNSMISVPSEGQDAFGAVVYLHDWICQQQYAQEPNTSWCVPGTDPMIVPVSGCEDSLHTTEIVTYVCSQMDHCCNPTGAWDGACVNLGVYYANTVNAKGAVLGDICGRDAWSQSSIRSSSGKYQNYPRDFNVFTFTGDVTHMYEVQGPIATPGSFVASSFRLNWSSAAMPIALVADSLSLAQGTIYGDVYYDHGSQPGQTVTMQNGGEFYQGTTLPVDFVTAATRLTSMSNALSRYSQNTAVTIDPSSQTITLDGVRKDLSVVNLTSSELNAARHISITVPVGAAMLINVHGGTSGSSSDPYPAFSNVSIQMLNGTLINDVLWNFPDAVQVSMSSVHFAGSLLAPQAALYEIGGGEILGTLVVKSVASATYMEVYFYPFSNNWFVK